MLSGAVDGFFIGKKVLLHTTKQITEKYEMHTKIYIQCTYIHSTVVTDNTVHDNGKCNKYRLKNESLKCKYTMVDRYLNRFQWCSRKNIYEYAQILRLYIKGTFVVHTFQTFHQTYSFTNLPSDLKINRY